MGLADLLELDKSSDQVTRAIAELRFAAIVCREKTAAQIFMGTPDDFSEDIPRTIVQSAIRAIRDKLPGGATIANIAELSGVSEHELRQLAYRVTADIAGEYETYAARIIAEGFRDRMARAFSDGFETLVRAPWQDVELLAAQAKQTANRVNMAKHERGRNDIGTALQRIRTGSESLRVIGFPWRWFNTVMEGGLHSSQKMYLVGPPGSRKSTFKYNAELFWARNGECVVDFIFDGGTVEAQSAKVAAIRWRQLCQQENRRLGNEIVPLDILVDTGAGWASYEYINKTTYWNVISAKPEDNLDEILGFRIPDGPMELLWRAYDELQDLTVNGKGPGRITFVEPGEVLSNFALMRQRLESERYDGMTVWCFDNHTKGVGRATGEVERVIELVRTLHTFTDESHIPCLILAHMPKEAIANISKAESGLIMYGGPIEQDCDFEFLAQYDKARPNQLKMSLPKNREEESGQGVYRVLTIDQKSGLITEV